MQSKLTIEYLPVKQLHEYSRNAKKHPPEQVEQIKKSIQDYGMRDPIGIWGPNNIIVEGHGRLLACKALGMTDVPCVRLDDMTDKQRREYALVHNQTTMNTSYDFSVLDVELSELDSFDSEFYDFIPPADSGQLDDLFAPANEKEKKPKQVQCPHCGEWFDV